MDTILFVTPPPSTITLLNRATTKMTLNDEMKIRVASTTKAAFKQLAALRKSNEATLAREALDLYLASHHHELVEAARAAAQKPVPTFSREILQEAARILAAAELRADPQHLLAAAQHLASTRPRPASTARPTKAKHKPRRAA